MGAGTGTSGWQKTTQRGVVAGDPPTIYDVARIAGVTPSTVSRALAKPGRVSFRTAERIREVAEEIGYRSTTLARAFSEQPTTLMAMIVADITNPVFHGMIRGAERTAAHAGYTTLVITLAAHRFLAGDVTWRGRVIPTFRPDK